VQEGKESVHGCQGKTGEVLEAVQEKEAEEELQEDLLPSATLALALAAAAEPFAAAALAAEGLYRPYRQGQ